jgi:hypothetical protein
MAHERLRFPEPTRRRRALPSAFRNGLRATALAGAALAVLGALLPYMRVWEPGHGWTDITGFQQAGDGGFVLELAVVAAVLVWVDNAWNSRVVVLVVGPGLLGLACLFILRDFYQAGVNLLAGLSNGGGHGDFEPGFWTSVVGALVLTGAGAVTTWRARDRLSFRPGTTVSGVATVVGGVVGAVVGFAVGAAITPLLFHGFVGPTSFVLVIVATVLALFGAWFGATVASATARGLRRP